jgi:hypothetical protein
MGMLPANIWGGGSSFTVEYHYQNLLSICRDDLTTRFSDSDFYVTANNDNNKIQFEGNFVESRGITKLNYALIEGTNITDIKFDQSGPIINQVYLAGQGMDWGDARITASANDEFSASQYGLRESAIVYGDISNQQALDSNAEMDLSKNKLPRYILDFTALDLAPAEFGHYDIGDTLKIELANYDFDGFVGDAKIIQRDYMPVDNLCRVIVEVLT